jgi:hypothetical protein
MREGIEYAFNHGFRSVVLLTDGETPWPDPWPAGLIGVTPEGVVRNAC